MFLGRAADQARIAEAYVAQLRAARVFDSPIVTTIETETPFYAAEASHQDFLARNPTNGYIVINDLPKIDALRRVFPDAFSAAPVLVKPGRRMTDMTTAPDDRHPLRGEWRPATIRRGTLKRRSGPIRSNGMS
jgi:hypothetical protein